MNYIKQNHLSLLIILWLVVSPMLFGGSTVDLGAAVRDVTTISNTWKFNPGTLQLGPNGATITELKSTTCTLSTTQLPLEATSTDVFYCAITGVASGDQVFVSLPSDNGAEGVANFSGFMLSYARASTTAGYIEVGLSNFSGVATSTFPLATTSVQVLYIDN